MILVDTSGVVAALNPDDPHSATCQEVLLEDPGPRMLSPFVLAEIDYFLSTRSRAADASVRFLEEVVRDKYSLAPFDVRDVRVAREIMQKFRDLAVGLTDASIVVLAERYQTNRVLTLDERHFRALRVTRGKPFVVLPADA